MVLVDSHRVPRVPWYSGANKGVRAVFVYGAITRYGRPFQSRSTNRRIGNSPSLLQETQVGPTTPAEKRLQSYNRQVWAIPRSLAATEGVAVAFLSSGYLDVSVPLVDFAEAMTGHDPGRVSPFGNPGFKACLTAPPGLSQPSTSFIVSRCLGIHHVHFVA